MYHVLELHHNRANIVFSGQLSQATGYVIEHYGKQLDEAIRSGIRILSTEALRGLDEVQQTVRDNWVPKFRQPIEGWSFRATRDGQSGIGLLREMQT